MGKVADELSARSKIDDAIIVGSEIRAALQELTDENARLTLVAGRYQFMFEAAQLCINRFDDYFEYPYDFSTKSGIKDQVRDYLARYTETISKVNKKGA